MMRSFEPGESWFWDFATERTSTGRRSPRPRRHPADQPAPGPARPRPGRLASAPALTQRGRVCRPELWPPPARRGREAVQPAGSHSEADPAVSPAACSLLGAPTQTVLAFMNSCMPSSVSSRP